jgi:1-deoxy-D-xylulose-5-phosphate synthase
MLADAAGHRAVVTVEDGVRDGGVGMAIADRIGAIAPAVPVHVLGIPARFLAHAANPDHILSQLGLDADGIADTIRERC